MRKRRRATRAIKFLILAFSVFVFTFAASEWFLEWSGLMPVPLYNQHVRWYAIEDIAAEKLILDVPQPFVTNDLGFWVGNPALPGVNKQGFRSPSFGPPGESLASVLVLGDQMAYGALAEPISACFADRLRSVGYTVHNLGIPDTGPRQYAKLVEHYVPKLQPKVVVVTFYTGNDFTTFPILKPSQPLMYFTNVGPIEAVDDNGNSISMEESYRARQLLFGDTILSNLAKIALSTRTCSFLVTATAPDKHSYEETTQEALAALGQIKEVCTKYQAKFMLLVVPVTPLYLTEINNPQHAREVLKDFDPQIPPGLGAVHYAPPPTAYLNNRGHAHYFEFISQWLLSHGLEPHPLPAPAAESPEPKQSKVSVKANHGGTIEVGAVDPKLSRRVPFIFPSRG